MSFRRQIGRLCAVSCAAIAAAGCATHTTTPQHAPLADAGRQAASWDAVLPGPRVAAAEPGSEYARRDDALNIRDTSVPENPPSVDYVRRVFIRARPEETVFFRPFGSYGAYGGAYRGYGGYRYRWRW